jgi:hypothetical protein
MTMRRGDVTMVVCPLREMNRAVGDNPGGAGRQDMDEERPGS